MPVRLGLQSLTVRCFERGKGPVFIIVVVVVRSLKAGTTFGWGCALGSSGFYFVSTPSAL